MNKITFQSRFTGEKYSFLLLKDMMFNTIRIINLNTETILNEQYPNLTMAEKELAFKYAKDKEGVTIVKDNKLYYKYEDFIKYNYNKKEV